MTILTPAAGYVRCSTDVQEDSPEQQKKEILTYASQHGYEITTWFNDFGKSGTTFEQRPEFQRLLATVESGAPFRAVICYDESRWGRAIDAEENGYWRVHFRRKGVAVLLVKTSIDPRHEYAPMLKSFESIQASQYSKKLSELTLRGAKNNGRYSSGGTAPYGYQRVALNLKTGETRVLRQGDWCVKGQEKVIWQLGDENEVEVVRSIFKKKAQGAGYITIAADLNRREIPCPKRGRWKNYDQKWSTGTLKIIIENPAYIGVRVYNRNSMSKIRATQLGRPRGLNVRYPHWTNSKEDWIIVEHAHEPIITKEVWELANSANKKTRGSTTPISRRAYLLTGLIRCSRCGYAFQGWSVRAKGRRYFKYVDGGWKSKRVCSHVAISKERLEQFVLQGIRETLAEPELMDSIERKMKQILMAEPDEVQLRRSQLTELLSQKRMMIRNLAEELAQGNRAQAVRSRLEELEREEKALVAEFGVVSKLKSRTISLSEVSAAISRFILHFEKEFENGGIESQKLLVRKCVKSIIVDREKSSVRVLVRRIPAATPWVEELLKKAEVTTGVVTSECSGDRNI